MTFKKSLNVIIRVLDWLMKNLQDNLFVKFQQIFIYFTLVANLLFKSIYEFLIENNMNPLGSPTIRELVEKPAGFTLVKKISNVGGLRKIRDSYIEWSSSHLRKEQSRLSKERRKLSKEDYIKAGKYDVLKEKIYASHLIDKVWNKKHQDEIDINEKLYGNANIFGRKGSPDNSGPEKK